MRFAIRTTVSISALNCREANGGSATHRKNFDGPFDDRDRSARTRSSANTSAPEPHRSVDSARLLAQRGSRGREIRAELSPAPGLHSRGGRPDGLSTRASRAEDAGHLGQRPNFQVRQGICVLSNAPVPIEPNHSQAGRFRAGNVGRQTVAYMPYAIRIH